MIAGHLPRQRIRPLSKQALVPWHRDSLREAGGDSLELQGAARAHPPRLKPSRNAAGRDEAPQDLARNRGARALGARAVAAVLAGLLAAGTVPPSALAQQFTGAAGSPPRRTAIFRIDPLGLDAEIVGKLERLLRIELERLAPAGLASAEEVQKLTAPGRPHASCEGDSKCLGALGRALGVDAMVTGNVGGLGDSYIINLKLVDSRTGTELRRIAEPLSGTPEQLIEGVRVAAYKLVAPERMRGSIAVLTDIPGGQVLLDGSLVGTTPTRTLDGIPIGEHQLVLRFKGAKDVSRPVPVRFEKTSSVVVHLRELAPLPGQKLELGGKTPFYQKWWFWAAVGVVAAGVGTGVGLALRPQPCDAPCR
jgi:hypothetical protein